MAVPVAGAASARVGHRPQPRRPDWKSQGRKPTLSVKPFRPENKCVFENSDVGAAGVLPDHLEVKVVAKAKLDPLQSRRFPAAEHEQRIAKLEEEIDRLQRTEEAIVVATGAPREAGCSPWVVLNVKAVGTRRPRRVIAKLFQRRGGVLATV